MNFTAWLKTDWTNVLSWFGTESSKVASFLYPVFQDAETLAKSDLLNDIIGGVPVVAAALEGAGGFPAALAAAEAFILPLLKTQGATLAQTTINTLSNGLVAQAQASLAATLPTGVTADPVEKTS